MLPGIQVLCERRGSECRIALSGRITIDSSADLRALLLLRLETNGCQTITVDLFEVTYIDTSGLAILVEVLKAARVRGKTFQISRLGEKPRYLLEATRLLHIFQDVTPAWFVKTLPQPLVFCTWAKYAYSVGPGIYVLLNKGKEIIRDWAARLSNLANSRYQANCKTNAAA